jgi:hypothetical protein
MADNQEAPRIPPQTNTPGTTTENESNPASPVKQTKNWLKGMSQLKNKSGLTPKQAIKKQKEQAKMEKLIQQKFQEHNKRVEDRIAIMDQAKLQQELELKAAKEAELSSRRKNNKQAIEQKEQARLDKLVQQKLHDHNKRKEERIILFQKTRKVRPTVATQKTTASSLETFEEKAETTQAAEQEKPETPRTKEMEAWQEEAKSITEDEMAEIYFSANQSINWRETVKVFQKKIEENNKQAIEQKEQARLDKLVQQKLHDHNKRIEERIILFQKTREVRPIVATPKTTASSSLETFEEKAETAQAAEQEKPEAPRTKEMEAWQEVLKEATSKPPSDQTTSELNPLVTTDESRKLETPQKQTTPANPIEQQTGSAITTTPKAATHDIAPEALKPTIFKKTCVTNVVLTKLSKNSPATGLGKEKLEMAKTEAHEATILAKVTAKPAVESFDTDRTEETRHTADTIKQIQIPPDPTSKFPSNPTTSELDPLVTTEESRKLEKPQKQTTSANPIDQQTGSAITTTPKAAKEAELSSRRKEEHLLIEHFKTPQDKLQTEQNNRAKEAAVIYQEHLLQQEQARLETWANTLERKEAEDTLKQYEQQYEIALQKDKQQFNELVACHEHAKITLQIIPNSAFMADYLSNTGQQIENSVAKQKLTEIKYQKILQILFQKTREVRPTVATPKTTASSLETFEEKAETAQAAEQEKPEAPRTKEMEAWQEVLKEATSKSPSDRTTSELNPLVTTQESRKLENPQKHNATTSANSTEQKTSSAIATASLAATEEAALSESICDRTGKAAEAKSIAEDEMAEINVTNLANAPKISAETVKQKVRTSASSLETITERAEAAQAAEQKKPEAPRTKEIEEVLKEATSKSPSDQPTSELDPLVTTEESRKLEKPQKQNTPANPIEQQTGSATTATPKAATHDIASEVLKPTILNKTSVTMADDAPSEVEEKEKSPTARAKKCYKCTLCQQMFAKQRGLKKHRKTEHEVVKKKHLAASGAISIEVTGSKASNFDVDLLRANLDISENGSVTNVVLTKLSKNSPATGLGKEKCEMAKTEANEATILAKFTAKPAITNLANEAKLSAEPTKEFETKQTENSVFPKQIPTATITDLSVASTCIDNKIYDRQSLPDCVSLTDEESKARDTPAVPSDLIDIDLAVTINGIGQNKKIVKLTAEDVYEVEKILEKRGKGKKVEYLVKWKNYDGPNDNTWEPANSLDGATDIVINFEENLKIVEKSLPSIAVPETEKVVKWKNYDGPNDNTWEPANSLDGATDIVINFEENMKIVEKSLPSIAVPETEKVYEVEKILEKRWKEKKVEYLVKWKNHEGPNDNTWEPANSLNSATDIISKFENESEKRDKANSSPENTKVEAEESNIREEPEIEEPFEKTPKSSRKKKPIQPLVSNNKRKTDELEDNIANHKQNKSKSSENVSPKKQKSIEENEKNKKLNGEEKTKAEPTHDITPKVVKTCKSEEEGLKAAESAKAIKAARVIIGKPLLESKTFKKPLKASVLPKQIPTATITDLSVASTCIDNKIYDRQSLPDCVSLTNEESAARDTPAVPPDLIDIDLAVTVNGIGQNKTKAMESLMDAATRHIASEMVKACKSAEENGCKSAESKRAIGAMGSSDKVIIGLSLLKPTILKKTSEALASVEKDTLKTVTEAEVAREATAMAAVTAKAAASDRTRIERAVSETIEYTRLEKLDAARVTKAEEAEQLTTPVPQSKALIHRTTNQAESLLILIMLTISSNKQQMASAQYSLAPPPQVSIKRNKPILQNDPQNSEANKEQIEADHPPTEAEMATNNEENENDTNNVPTYRKKVKTDQTKEKKIPNIHWPPSPQASMYAYRTPSCTYYPLSIPV